MKSWLLIDNSNGRTKFALGDRERLLDWLQILATSDITHERLDQVLNGVEYDVVVISSVVPVVLDCLRRYFENHGKLLHVISANSPLGIEVDYPNPQQLGADRLVNVCGGHHRYGAPCLIIDFGTAVTYDLVDERGAFIGGVIAPGVGVVKDYLPAKTALLPEISFEEPEEMIGKSTVGAMQVGVVVGYQGMVKEIIERMTGRMSVRPRVIATGGDAELIARMVGEIDLVDRQITLEGLRRVAQAVFG